MGPEAANRILIASKLPLEPLSIKLPDFDHHLAANFLGVRIPSLGISIAGLRVPVYKSTDLRRRAWEWLESTLASFRDSPSVAAGDFNVDVTRASPAGKSFRRILASGWQRAETPDCATYFGRTGSGTAIDHILATNHCVLSEAVCIQEAGGFTLASSPGAL